MSALDIFIVVGLIVILASIGTPSRQSQLRAPNKNRAIRRMRRRIK